MRTGRLNVCSFERQDVLGAGHEGAQTAGEQRGVEETRPHDADIDLLLGGENLIEGCMLVIKSPS